jgi:hypothetical protein
MIIRAGALLGLVLVLGGVAAAAPVPVVEEKKPAVVRPLKVMGLRFDDSAQGLSTYKSAAEVEKAAGKPVAEQIAKLVDFDKEDVVFVRWTSSGPPFGMLQHEVKDQAVEFYIKDPAMGKIRGQALRLGADFFGVTKGAKATMGPTRK